MTLSSETPSQFTQSPFSSAGSAVKAKQNEREEIENLTREFLRKKGNITECATGKSTTYETFKELDRRDSLSEPIKDVFILAPFKNNGKSKSKHGQNIRYNKEAEEFYVHIASVHLGRGKKWTKEQAIEARDRYREICKMPPAEY